MKIINIYGAGGHTKVIIEIAEALGYQIGTICDDSKIIKTILDYNVNTNPNEDGEWITAIGNNSIRKEIIEKEKRDYLTLIHPKAIISKRTIVDVGTVIMAGVTINSSVKIGKHCIINTNASIDHDCIIEDYVHISPNTALAGNIQIGEGTHIGIGTSIIPNIKIGKWCTIGAGSVIIRDVPDGVTVVGNPGRILKK